VAGATRKSATRFRIVRLSKIVWIASAFAASSVTLAADERTALKHVDLQLVVTVDVSPPMDRDEAIVARNGYIEAFRSPELTFVEWSDPEMQTVVVPWAIIDGSAAANEFANRLNRAPMQWLRSTSISGALLFSAGLIEKSGFSAVARSSTFQAMARTMLACRSSPRGCRRNQGTDNQWLANRSRST
jgi:hypothetical protein